MICAATNKRSCMLAQKNKDFSGTVIWKTDFTEIVKKLRERYTLMEISSATGIDYSVISRISSGDSDTVRYNAGCILVGEYNKIMKKENRKHIGHKQYEKMESKK